MWARNGRLEQRGSATCDVRPKRALSVHSSGSNLLSRLGPTLLSLSLINFLEQLGNSLLTVLAGDHRPQSKENNNNNNAF